MPACPRCNYARPNTDMGQSDDCPKCGPKYVKAKKEIVKGKPVGKVGLCLAAVFVVAMIWNSATQTSRPASSSATAITPAARSAAQTAIQLNGYKCDSLTHMRTLLVGQGYSVQCNNYAYTYIIKDVGGRLTVSVE